MIIIRFIAVILIIWSPLIVYFVSEWLTKYRK